MQHELAIRERLQQLTLYSPSVQDFLIGFSFADEGEASDFVKKVNARAKYCEYML